MIDTDRHWERWARQDPYFAVLSEPRFKAGAIHCNRDAFFESGERFVEDVVRRYRQQFGGPRFDRALEHGCGVGRIALPLARRFSSVEALDVSPAMIAEAKANAERQRAGNLLFALADDRLSNACGEFDFVISHLVLQHVPVRRGMRILSHLLGKVRPGGGFHITLSCRTESRAQAILYWASATVPGVKQWQNLCAGRAWNAPAMQMNDYPVEAIRRDLSKRGITYFMTSDADHPRFRTVTFLGRLPEEEVL